MTAMFLHRTLPACLLCASALAQPNPPPPPAPSPNPMAIGGNNAGYDMAPETTPPVVHAAVATLPVKLPEGPFKPSWESLQANYRVPDWFVGAKFGIFLHWGVYAVPAHHNEWYEKHMYANSAIRRWHVEKFGPIDKFGYKDFIPLFTAEKFDPQAWAELFQAAGARFIIPTAQHHDNFALWDSQVTRFNAKAMGPKRDLIGELALAVRARGLKFGISNHGIENFQFVNPSPELADELKAKKVDLYDPAWAEFYHVADRSDAALQRFLHDWFARNVELIEKYRPDMLWFDNGIDIRYLDPLKLRLAAYYYNRAQQWGQPVSISTKKAAFAPTGLNNAQIGSIVDFEKVGARSPSGIRTGVWQVDDAIGSTWGYTEGMRTASPNEILRRLIDTVSKNGTYLLNLSPKADGTIPQDQQDVLREIGRWLEVNGEAIYGTHNWTTFGIGGGRGESGPHVRFTVKPARAGGTASGTLYALLIGSHPSGEITIAPLTPDAAGRITGVTLLGSREPVAFTQDASGLKVRLPSSFSGKYAYALKLAGAKTNPPTWTSDGNPM